jgi:hypothetical protein
MATYLGWSQARDPRLFTSYRSWEAPLEAARELAPGSREPDRLLAVAYLEVWQLLSPRKKEVARGLLRTLLADPEDRNRFLEPWLATASDRREAFAVIPPAAAAWDAVAQAYARRADWPGFAAARRRWDGVLLAELHRDLGRAARCKEDGDPACARDLYLGVATRTRTEPRFLPLLDQALAECPPGPVGRERAAKLAPQLAAAVDRCLLAECSLSPGALERLARFVRDAPVHQQALALLFAGEPAEASALERRANVQWSAEWGPYLIVKARGLVARGRSEEAREALVQLHRDWEDHPLAWQARRELAVQTGAAGEAAQAVAHLEAAGRTVWPETAWTVRRGAQRLEMVAAVPATGLVVELAVVEDQGAVVELHLDGALAGTFVVTPGSTPLTLAQPVASGFHVLELHIVAGGLVLPGSVRLR